MSRAESSGGEAMDSSKAARSEEPSSPPAPVFTIHHEGVALRLRWLDSAPRFPASQPVLHICSPNAELLVLLTADHNMYSARRHGQEMLLSLEYSKVSDVDYCAATRQLFIVLDSGSVLMQTIPGAGGEKESPADWRICPAAWSELFFDPLELYEDGVRVRRVCCSTEGTLFVSSTGDTYVMGSCGDVFDSPNQPKPMRFFDEKTKELLDVSAGTDFFVLLLKKSCPAPSGAENSPPKADLLHDTSTTDEVHSNSSLRSRSSSASTSSRLNGEQRSDWTLHRLLQEGQALLLTQVYSFGSQNNGILGTGDHVKRNTVHNVQRLESIGVCSIATGRAHSVARTLDGRLYHWGLGRRRTPPAPAEVNPLAGEDLSAPSELKFDTKELSSVQSLIVASCCGDYRTLLMNAVGDVQEEGGPWYRSEGGQTEADLITLQMGTHARKSPPLLLARGSYTVRNRRRFQLAYYYCLHLLRRNLQKMLDQRRVVQQLVVYQSKFPNTALQQLQPLCSAYRLMVVLQASLLHSLERFYRGDFSEPHQLAFVRYHRECIDFFAEYLNVFCDTYALDVFHETSKWFGGGGGAGIGPSQGKAVDFVALFQQPFKSLKEYEQFLSIPVNGRRAFPEQLAAWESLSAGYVKAVELAKQTQEFWQQQARQTKLHHLRSKQRRMLLSSTNLKAKYATALGSSQPLFVLFSDYLCELGGQLNLYPLDVLWLQRDAKCLRLITPEKSFRLTSRSEAELKAWAEALEAAIAEALGRPGSGSVSRRLAGYRFSSSHPKYANVEAYGLWLDGMLHGNCCQLEYPDGKLYCGSMRYGEIEGHGHMVLPSLGMYEGGFKAGKFHGHGCYEMRDNAVYEGNFRDNLLHGHGCWRSNHHTYVGEYQANLRCGYGVLDDTLTGDKYMGMFADNKRTGAGTCVTIGGDYFEGVFTNDALSEASAGVAVFENGSYYEGAMTMLGPAGRGSYFMPAAAASRGDGGAAAVVGGGSLSSADTPLGLDDDDVGALVPGTILAGHLGGSWDSVSIANGNMMLHQQFPRFSKLIGELVVDNTRKWRSLFDDFEAQLAECLASTRGGGSGASSSSSSSAKQQQHAFAQDPTKHLWKCIAVFMAAERERKRRLDQQQHLPMSPPRRGAARTPQHSSYFGKNIAIGFGVGGDAAAAALSGYDKLSLKSSSSPPAACRHASILDVSSVSWHSGGAADGMGGEEHSLRQSHSQETLNDSVLCDDLDSLTTTSRLNATASTTTLNEETFGSQLMEWDHNSSVGSLRSSLSEGVPEANNNNNSSLLQHGLDFIPSFGIAPGSLTSADVFAIRDYLTQAFKDPHHPLFILNKRVEDCFYTSYGCWKMKPTPILAKQVMHEWESIARRVYQFVRKMFPALPEEYCVLESSREVVSHITLLYPIVLSERIYSTLFVLYANKYSRKDEVYRQSLLHSEKLEDEALMELLGLESSQLPIVRSEPFNEGIQALKQLQEKYSPKAMLTIIENCFHHITEAYRYAETSQTLAADNMMPLTLFLILRAAVPHLGAELALLDDLTLGANFEFEMNGKAGYCYTTLKAAYEHITAKPLTNAYA